MRASTADVPDRGGVFTASLLGWRADSLFEVSLSSMKSATTTLRDYTEVAVGASSQRACAATRRRRGLGIDGGKGIVKRRTD